MQIVDRLKSRLRVFVTVRLRLTMIFAGLFFAGGFVLLVLTLGLLVRALALPPNNAPGNQNGEPGVTRQADAGTIEDQIRDVRRIERRSAIRQVVVQALIAMSITSIGALVLGWAIAGRTLRPIREITQHARAANASTLDQRIDLRGPPDEMRELADTFDGMLDRLQSAFMSQRRFSATVSHELRTPLAIIGAEADLLLAAPDASPREREMALAVRRAADRSERLVDGLLTLSRSESTMHDQGQIDLADVAGDVMGALIQRADARGVAVTLDLESAPVRGDRMLLERMIGNLVENAIAYNRQDGKGWIRLRVGVDEGFAVLSVENSGQGTPIADVDALLEPFRRGARNAGAGNSDTPMGFGLGLAIVRSVVLAHDGTLNVTGRPDGGLVVLVRLPTPSDAASDAGHAARTSASPHESRAIR